MHIFANQNGIIVASAKDMNFFWMCWYSQFCFALLIDFIVCLPDILLIDFMVCLPDILHAFESQYVG